MHFYVSRTIRRYVTAEISFIRESIQGDEQTTATFRTSPEIMAEVTTYDPKELLVILFNHVANFLSVGSGWRFDSVQNLAIYLCLFRPTIGAGPSYKRPSPYTVRSPQYPKPQRRFLFPLVRSRTYSQNRSTCGKNFKI